MEGGGKIVGWPGEREKRAWFIKGNRYREAKEAILEELKLSDKPVGSADLIEAVEEATGREITPAHLRSLIKRIREDVDVVIKGTPGRGGGYQQGE